MSTLDPLRELAGTCLNNGGMPAAWDRLASFVVARRVELGYKSRPRFTEAAGVSLRTLADLETGRRDSYDAATLAALEQALRWTTGSIARVLAGDDPVPAPTRNPMRATLDGAAPSETTTGTSIPSRHSDALIRVMKNDRLSDDDKKKIVRLLLAEQEAFERGRVARADELARLFEGDG